MMRVFAMVAVWLALLAPAWGADLDALRRDLAGPDGNARRKAAEALGSLDTPEAVELLARAYRAETRDAFGVKAACAVALGRTGRPEAAGPLSEMLSDPDYWVRKKAAEALERIPGEAAVRALERAAADPDPRVRARAVEALGRRHGPPEVFRKAWADSDPRVRAAALTALVASGDPEARAFLEQGLASGPWQVRLRAAALLARLGDPRGAEVLADAVRRGEHAGAALREWSCLGEGAVGSLVALYRKGGLGPGPRNRLLAVLEELDCAESTRFFVDLASDRSAPPADRVRAAMVLFDRRQDLDAGQVRAVADLLDERDPNLQAVALQILLDRGGARYLPRIVPLTGHENPVVRHFALANLARFGDTAYEEVFIRALSDRKGSTVRLAVEALGRIGSERAIPALEEVAQKRKYRRFARAAIEAIRGRAAAPAGPSGSQP